MPGALSWLIQLGYYDIVVLWFSKVYGYCTLSVV